MGYKACRYSNVLTMKHISYVIILILLAVACAKQPPQAREEVRLHFFPTPDVRSASPPEDAVDDVNIFIFGPEGTAEEHIWARGKDLKGGSVKASLVKGVPYTFFVCANTGYRMQEASARELEEMRYFLTYPDEFSRGIPMSAVHRNIPADDVIDLQLTRCMAKLELRMDRSKLYSGVNIDIESIEVGACPRSVQLFAESKARSTDDLFPKGYIRSGVQAGPLNTDEKEGMSQPLCLYLLENCQGTLLEGATGPEDKVFGSLDKTGELCSYVELHASYRSSRYCNRPGEYLIYRFYLGESLNNFDVHRNVNYNIIIRPEGSGLNEDSWRVDRNALEPT